MDSKLVKEALEALAAGDTDKAMEILKGAIVDAAAGADAGASAEPEAMMGDEEEEEPTTMMGDGEDDPEAMAAAARTMMALTGQKTPGAAVAVLTRSHQTATDIRTRERQLAADRRKLEAGERDELVARMVEIGKEDPATAWADPVVATDRDKRKPAEPWASMPLPQLRKRVKAMGAAPSSTSSTQARTPTAGSGTVNDDGRDETPVAVRTMGKVVNIPKWELDRVKRSAEIDKVDVEEAVERYARIKLQQQPQLAANG